MHRVMSALSRNLCIYPCVSGNEFGLFFEYNIYFAQYTANNNIYNKMLNIIAPILKYANIYDKLKAQYMVMIVHSIIAMSVEKAAYERKVHMCIFRKNRALAPHERSAVPLGTDHCPVG